ncbi:MAG: hypothetical protein KDC34_11060 [Saprospiraceae bacterium]|nr:hypothetical protein [Saprospiraceae bacterium]
MVKQVLMVLVLLAVGCSTPPLSYEELVERELASGEINTELFLGIDFGMSSKDFYAHCWELNKEETIRQGPGNLSVQYEPEELDYPGTINFYPEFYQDRIVVMPMIFEYKSWAPWNKDLFSDKLVIDVKDMFESWYGKGFIVHDDPELGKVLVKVDGNRQVMIHIKDDRLVEAWISDLRTQEELKAAQESTSSL